MDGSIGILALQGDYEAHAKALDRRGVPWRYARTAQDVRASRALVIPGGESTTLLKLMEGTGIGQAIRDVAERGDPVFGTCAGAILLAETVSPAGEGLGLLPITVVRNAYGRQLESTVLRLTDVDAGAFGSEPLEAVFIRAPRIEAVKDGVEILARRNGDPVLVRKENVMASTFHPELTDDTRVLDLFLAARREGAASGARQAAP